MQRILKVCWGIVFMITQVLIVQGQEQGPLFNHFTPSAPTTPSAAMIQGVSNATVNKSTGVVTKQVPIYTIEQDGINWNVGLGYSYSGLRVLSEPSMVGLGWNLIGGAAVMREVRGLPDDHPYGYYGSENLRAQLYLDDYVAFQECYDDNNDIGHPCNGSNNSSYPQTNSQKVIKEHHAYLLAQGLADGEPDVFHIRAGGINVSFKLGENLTPILLSHHNVQVFFSWDEITVIDSSGTTYVFNQKESYAPQVEDDDDVDTDPFILPDAIDSTPYTRSWYLTSITPATSNRTITFEYDTTLFKTRDFAPKIYSYKGQLPEFRQDPVGGDEIIPFSLDDLDADYLDYYVYNYTRLPIDIQMPVLKKISFSKGSVDVNYQSVPTGDYPLIQSIAVKDFFGQTVSDFDLTTIGNRRLLTRIDRNQTYMYEFSYYNPEQIMNYQYNENDVHHQIDFWGYYTGAIDGTKNVIKSNNFNQLPIYNSTLTGALKEIKNRADGKTHIEYELNKRTIRFNATQTDPNSDVGWEANQVFSITTEDAQLQNGERSDQITRTFDQPTQISISHSGEITQYGALMELKILKEGYQGDYVPYFYCGASDTPQLAIDVYGEDATATAGAVQYSTSGACGLTIQPGTYIFFVRAGEGAQASINVNIAEAQTYRKEAHNEDYGGLRVKQITNYDEQDTKISQMRYDYTNEDLTSSARIYTLLTQGLRADSYSRFDGEESFEASFFNIDQVVSYPFYVEGRGLPIYYSKVSESTVSTAVMDDRPLGKTTYTFELPRLYEQLSVPDLFHHNILDRKYYDRAPKGNILNGPLLQNTKTYAFDSELKSIDKFVLKTEQIYEYERTQDVIDSYGDSQDPSHPYSVKVISKTGAKRPYHIDGRIAKALADGFGYFGNTIPAILEFEEHYKNGTQAQFEDYVEFLFSQVDIDRHSSVGSVILQYKNGVGGLMRENRVDISDNDFPIENTNYAIIEYKDANVRYLTTRQTTRTYSDEQPSLYVETTQEFEYDDNNQLITQRQTNNSQGEVVTTQLYYPYHPSINNSALIADNRISTPIKTETFNDGTRLQVAQAEFSSFEGKTLLAATQTAKGQEALQDQQTIHKYRNGIPIEVSTLDGMHTIYVLGYQDSYPIAVIANASYTGMPASAQALIDAAITASNADTSPATENALRTTLAALRNHSYFEQSQIQTYTYDPLIGMTSQQDVTGNSMYYYYDALNRLQEVRDRNGKLINDLSYNYKN